MCGIAGVIAWDERFAVSRDVLEMMSARIAHRGPDGAGIWISGAKPQAALVHRRLAIIDPDPRADQPFTDGRRWLVYNGEIYNFRELRAELSQLRPDYHWRTQCDTEVLLVAYDAWREKCVEHFNGMFAFAIWDDVEKSLFLARDRMGQKPLYLAQNSGGIAFASELGALRAVPWFDGSMNTAALGEYLRWGYVPGDGTIYQGARKLPPATTLQICQSESREEKYFDPNISAPHAEEPVGETRRLATQAVHRQLVADVPLGCFLSGGIDSSVIAAAMVAAGGEVKTFSIGFDDAKYDETKYAQAVAKHLGTQHHAFVVRPDAAADLPKLAAVFGEPFADSSALPTHYLARETRLHVKVALSGDGGDELFGGYDRYRALGMSPALRWTLAAARGAGALAVVKAIGSAAPKSKRAVFERLLSTTHNRASVRYSRIMRLFDDASLSRLFQQPVPDHDTFIEQFERLMFVEDMQKAAALDRVTYLPDDLLAKVDRASMLHALEVRSPFMDHELVHFAAGLSKDELLKGGPKRMLRDAFAADLPPFVFKRRKMGFAVPIGDWFRGKLRPMLNDHLFAADSFARTHFNIRTVRSLIEDHERRAADHSQRLYALLMLELWHRQAK